MENINLTLDDLRAINEIRALASALYEESHKAEFRTTRFVYVSLEIGWETSVMLFLKVKSNDSNVVLFDAKIADPLSKMDDVRKAFGDAVKALSSDPTSALIAQYEERLRALKENI